jgi:hypothetical protein
LITPGVLVIQAHEMKELEPVARWPGTAVAALMPPAAARFTHDPAAGPALWQRLSVTTGSDARLARLGPLSAGQQHEELQQLHALATRPAVVAAATGDASVEPRIDAADRLAAWLLQQAHLSPVGE